MGPRHGAPSEASAADPGPLREVERCALCASPRRSLAFREPPFSVVRCDDCGLVYVTPRLASEALPDLYGHDYWRSDRPSHKGYGDYLADAELYRKTFRMRLRGLERHLPATGRALDVGCAAGFFLQVLRERGWDVHGVEPSPVVARHAREQEGLDVHAGDLESAPWPPGHFDLVSFWDVVEHLADPARALRRAAQLLKPDGVLVVETQNVESAFARLLGRRWQHYKHWEHLYHFGPETLERLLRLAGFEMVEVTPRRAGKHVSLAFVRERATRLHPALRWPLRALAPLDRVSLYVNPRDELIAVARKAGV